MTETVLICGGGARTRDLATAVTAQGANAVMLPGGVFDDKAEADRAITSKGLATGSVDVILIPVAFDEVATPAPVEGMDETRWKALAEDPLLRVRNALQVASTLVKAPGGAVVLLVPEVGITGVAGLAAQSMAVEGARTIAKSVARVWAARGITVNSIGIAVTQITGETDSRTRPSLDDVAKLALIVAQGRAATGNTIFADGGEVMSF